MQISQRLWRRQQFQRNQRWLIHPLKSRQLNVLEKRGSGRQARRVEKSRVENPVAGRRAVNVRTAFERPVVVVRVEQIDQRTGVIEPRAAPIFKKTFEIMHAARQSRIAAALIRRVFITASRVAGEHREPDRRFGGISLALGEWITKRARIFPTV